MSDDKKITRKSGKGYSAKHLKRLIKGDVETSKEKIKKRILLGPTRHRDRNILSLNSGYNNNLSNDSSLSSTLLPTTYSKSVLFDESVSSKVNNSLQLLIISFRSPCQHLLMQNN
ncbi:uncharacterized protein LOC116176569 [Photinus pyralis]|uniref:uncharacterized protein LOC116176569 n=1 Tax=Photinus pyralis TaxID=7054 RepID=UPI001266F79D|nr:uncharacterized protein LOC116176569 [Photinus pyralis]